jgi:F-type H+-transporting ATPase subunit gamma
LLFPLDLAQGPVRSARLPPLHNLPAPSLLEKLIAEHVLALLTEAATESLASENAARFRAMESAHENIRKKRDRLLSEARQARQEEITTELLDVVTGAAAIERDAR